MSLTTGFGPYPEFARAHLVVSKSDEVSVGDVGQFLRLFDNTYVALSRSKLPSIDEVGGAIYVQRREVTANLERTFRDIWVRIPRINRASTSRKQIEGLKLVSISKSSPLEFVAEGLSVAITLAVVFSGGEIRLPGFSAKLPPLGTGIKALRDALGDTNRKHREPPDQITSKIHTD